jgi:hypothetical protein
MVCDFFPPWNFRSQKTSNMSMGICILQSCFRDDMFGPMILYISIVTTNSHSANGNSLPLFIFLR